MRRLVCKPKPAPARPALDLSVAMWTTLSPLARWTLIGWGVRPSNLTMGLYAAVRSMA